jgi:hypothetical protein
MRNSKSFGTIITKNRAQDRKIWLWKISRAKWSLQEVLGVFVEFLSG